MKAPAGTGPERPSPLDLIKGIDPQTEQPPREAREALAAFVAVPGKPARVLRLVEGRKVAGPFLTIGEAVATGQSFMVPVARYILAVDCDHRDGLTALEDLAGEVHASGYRPVTVSSGRPNGQHLFAFVPDPRPLAAFKEKAGAGRLDVRTWIRPPLAPHPARYPVRLLQPPSPEEAVAALRPYPLTPRPLSPRARRWLRYGDTGGRYESGSELVMAITTAAVSAGWGFEELSSVLLDPQNKGGEAFRERLERRGEQRTREWLGLGYEKAVIRVAEHPPEKRHEELERVCQALGAVADELGKKGIQGRTDRAVLLATVTLARRCRKLSLALAVRDLAEEAACSRATVSTSLKRMREYLKPGPAPRGGQARVYTLTAPVNGTELDTLSHAPPSEDECPNPSRHDVFRWGGLGPAKGRLYELLQERPSWPIEQLADAYGARSATVRKHLRRLAAHGLAMRGEGGEWSAVADADLDALARSLGRAGDGERQRAQHHRERLAFREHIERRTGADSLTGEALSEH